MKKETLLKVKELFDLIEDTDEECIILGENPEESNIIGTERVLFIVSKNDIKITSFPKETFAPRRKYGP